MGGGETGNAAGTSFPEAGAGETPVAPELTDDGELDDTAFPRLTVGESVEEDFFPVLSGTFVDDTVAEVEELVAPEFPIAKLPRGGEFSILRASVAAAFVTLAVTLIVAALVAASAPTRVPAKFGLPSPAKLPASFAGPVAAFGVSSPGMTDVGDDAPPSACPCLTPLTIGDA